MRYGRLLAAMLGVTLASVGFNTLAAQLPTFEVQSSPTPQRRQRRAHYYSAWLKVRPAAKSQKHTGGGARTAHTIWKRKRASGRR